MSSQPPSNHSRANTLFSRDAGTVRRDSSGDSSSDFSVREAPPRSASVSSEDNVFGLEPVFTISHPPALYRHRPQRIALPNAAASPLSPDAAHDLDVGPHTPQTTTMPRSPLSRAASEFVVDPNTAAILQEFRVQQSTMALLSADLSTKGLIEASRSRASPIPSKHTSDVSVRKRGPSFNIFRRVGRGSSTSAQAVPASQAVSERRRSGLTDEDPLSPDADPHVSGAELPEVVMEADVSDSHKDGTAAIGAPGVSSSTSNEDAGADKEDGDGGLLSNAGELENVLKEAADVHGIRLTWLLYAMIAIVIALFIMLFIQITYMTNGTLRRTGSESVQAKMSSLANNAEMMVSELSNFYEVAFRVMLTLVADSGRSEKTDTEIYDMCSRLFGSPIAVNLYNTSGALIQRTNCPGEQVIPIYGSVPAVSIASPDGPRMVLYSENVIAAFRSVALTDDPTQLSTISVFLKRQVVGQFFLSNALASFSSATLQDVYTAVVLPLSARTFQPGALAVALRTLDSTAQNYTTGEDSATTVGLLDEFNRICRTSNKYVWQKVMRPLTLDLDPNFTSPDAGGNDVVQSFVTSLPSAYMEFKSTWGLLSMALQCGVVCSDSSAMTCSPDNPTNIYIMTRSTVRSNGWSSVTSVAAVSIAAVVVFSMLLVFAYFSISTPVHFLRFQIMGIVGIARKRTRIQRTIDRFTHRIWIGDMRALVRAVHVLGICFRVNKKYVPLHVMRAIAAELSRQRLNVFEDYDVNNCESDDADTGAPGSPLQLVPRNGMSDDTLTNALPANVTMLVEPIEMEERQEESPAQRVAIPELSSAARDDTSARSVELATFSPLPLAGVTNTNTVSALRELDNSMALPFGSAERAFADQSGIFGESTSMETGVVDLGASGAFSATLVRSMVQPQSRHMVMSINRDDGATILAVRIGGVDSAYLFNYSVTARNHQAIMAFLLRCIRRHRGSIFYRTGDCLGAVWNAFDSCANHAARAAACACDMSSTFAEHRQKGLQVGVVLHQGNFVFGNVDDSKEAFTTAFGEAPQQAITLADYAAPQHMLNIVVTEPVKQSLSTLYEFAIVDVVRVTGNSNHLILFDLCGRRDLPPAAHALSSPAHSTFAIEYAKAFSLFRDNRFDAAVQAVAAMGPLRKAHEQRLTSRLDQLSRHFARHPTTVPRPYCRPFPHWANYEMMALADMAALGSQRQPRPYASFGDLTTPIKSETTSPRALPLPSIDDVAAKLVAADDALSFKRDLHDNMRRLGTPNCGTSVTSCVTLPTSVALRPELALSPMSPISPMTPSVQAHTLRLPHRSVSSLVMRDVQDRRTSTLASRSPLSPNAASLSTNHPGGSGPQSGEPHDELHEDAPPMLSVGGRWTMEDDSVSSVISTSSFAELPPTLVGLAPPTSTAFSPGNSITTPSMGPGEVGARRATSFVTALSGSAWHADSSADRSHDRPDELATRAGTTTLEEEDSSHSGAGDKGPTSSSDNNALVQQPSIIQSMSFNLDATMPVRAAQSGDAAGSTEIHAKNGNTYLRSGRLLGRGSFGSVYMGVDVNSGKLVAVKYLPLRPDEDELAGIEAEVMIMQRVKDSHVVEFISYAFEDDHIVLIMECMMAGSLQNMITAFHTLPSSTARVFIRDVLRGLNKLHSMGVVHRDVKPQNVLLTLSGSCKISDFGASASIQELARKDSEGRVFGTPVYLAPEAAQGKPVKKSDIWSCGIMFLQLLTGSLPYAEEKLSLDAPLLVYQIGSYIARPIIPSNLDEMDVLFARECLREESAARPTAAQLLQMPLFAL